MQVRASKLRYQGTRAEQQDQVGVIELAREDNSGSLAVGVLTDGIGGLPHGGEASQLVNEQVREYLQQADLAALTGQNRLPDILRQAANFADRALGSYRRQHDLGTCGTTLLITVIASDHMHFLSVGDSILWVLDGANMMVRVNREHVLSKDGHTALTSAVLGDGIAEIDCGSIDLRDQGVKRILLSSDGILTLSFEQVGSRLREQDHGLLQQIVSDAIQAKAPAQDNLSMILFDLL